MLTLFASPPTCSAGRRPVSRGFGGAQRLQGPEFTRLFYSNPEKYGFAIQMTLHAQRAAAASLVSDTIRVLDRSLIGDWAFALWNRASGNLTETEWQVYLERAGQAPKQLISRFPANTIVLYLQDSPKHCHKRLELRNGVDAGVPLSYLQGLHAAHLIVLAFLPKSFRQVRVPWSVYSTIQRFDDEFVEKIIMQAGERPIDYFPILLKAAKAAIADIESQNAREFLEFQVKRLQSDADI